MTKILEKVIKNFGESDQKPWRKWSKTLEEVSETLEEVIENLGDADKK